MIHHYIFHDKYIYNKSIYSGNVTLISLNYVLVSGHCFKEEDGYVCKPLDFKIVKLKEPIIKIEPAPLMVSESVGKSLQLYFSTDFQLMIKEYISSDNRGYVSRSDLGLMRTYYGESGAPRYSLTHNAIHSIHQGESEALTVNGANPMLILLLHMGLLELIFKINWPIRYIKIFKYNSMVYTVKKVLTLLYYLISVWEMFT